MKSLPMKRYHPFLAALFCLLAAMQTNGQRRVCASYEVLQQQLATHPEMAIERQRLESFTEQFEQMQSNETAKTTAPIYKIPVVVHVLYNTTAQNISTAQIQSQIDILNKDYQKLNTDASLVPSVFAGVAADAQIQFCLAQRTPTGQATTGINRIQTSKTSFNANTDDAKSASTGGANAWDRNKYLNIWIVPSISGGVLGYAQFPGGPAATDGVVIGHQYFGNTGTATAPYNKGRTATHEIGHWLNLNHIWGDDGTACTGTDNVGDTPNQADENYGCPTFPSISCNNGPNGDMFMNYMDYTDDACMFMFTTGQKTRMHAVLAGSGSRAALLTSDGCLPPSTTGVCAVPSSLATSTLTSSSATLTWGAVTGAQSYTLRWKLNTATAWTTVANVTSTSYNLTGLTSNTTYNFSVLAKCSATNSSAYSASVSFTTQLPCTNNFEPNNTSATATALTINTASRSMIGTSTDVDYYSFSSVSTAKNLRVTVSTLPADYDLKLYSPSGTLLNTSQNTGTTSEVIVYNNAPTGSYRAQVYGYNGAFSASQCYTILAERSATAFREGGEATTVTVLEAPARDEITFYPNPASNSVSFDFYSDEPKEVMIQILDQSGRMVQHKLLSLTAGANQPTLDVTMLPTGMYFVKFVGASLTITSRLMVAH